MKNLFSVLLILGICASSIICDGSPSNNKTLKFNTETSISYDYQIVTETAVIDFQQVITHRADVYVYNINESVEVAENSCAGIMSYNLNDVDTKLIRYNFRYHKFAGYASKDIDDRPGLA